MRDDTSRTLLPFEIIEILDKELNKPEFVSECTAAYLTLIRSFVMDNVVKVMADLRRAHKMFDALERQEEWDRFTDLSMGASRKDT